MGQLGGIRARAVTAVPPPTWHFAEGDGEQPLTSALTSEPWWQFGFPYPRIGRIEIAMADAVDCGCGPGRAPRGELRPPMGDERRLRTMISQHRACVAIRGIVHEPFAGAPCCGGLSRYLLVLPQVDACSMFSVGCREARGRPAAEDGLSPPSNWPPSKTSAVSPRDLQNALPLSKFHECPFKSKAKLKVPSP